MQLRALTIVSVATITTALSSSMCKDGEVARFTRKEELGAVCVQWGLHVQVVPR